MSFRGLMIFIHDLIAAGAAWWLAYLLRYNFEPADWAIQAVMAFLPWVVAVQGCLFAYLGLYRGVWRFASLPDLRRILIAAGLGAFVLPIVLFMLQRLADVPRSVLVLDPLILVLLMGGSRFLYRSWKDGSLVTWSRLHGEPVLVLGAGEAAVGLLKALANQSRWGAVGLLDDDPAKLGTHFVGVPVLGAIADTGQVAKRCGVRHVVIAMPSATAAERRRAAEMAVAAGLKVLTVPSTEDLLSGRVSISQIRRVELEDLLGREPVQLDDVGLQRLIEGRVVLVTGAGGSIGSELCRQIVRFRPQRLVLYEQSEFALYQIEQEFTAGSPAVQASFLVGDVKDEARLDQVFREHHPHLVFHAAAYKHVPLMEQDNAWQAVRNNVIGTRAVAEAAQRHGAEKFVLISTDKAVNPTNVMGASKRLAERVLQQLQQPAGTRLVTVRFGNVLGSNGSVIPKFREQIAQGGPVTVTHPEIIRYFMLIPEASRLVLQAGLMGNGGEIFVLDMGEPIRIADLARDMIRLSGFTEDEIRIVYTGLRPGEKLFEELLADDEQTLPTPHPKLRIAKARESDGDRWLSELAAWLATTEQAPEAVRSGLQQFVPEYQPQASGAQATPAPTTAEPGHEPLRHW